MRKPKLLESRPVPHAKKQAKPFTRQAIRTSVEIMGRAPTVYVKRNVLSHIWHLVDLVPHEVGWLGTVSRRPNGDFLIEKIFLFRQRVRNSTNILLGDGLAEVGTRIIQEELDGLETVNKLRFWGHSHVDFPAVPSWQDDKQMEELSECGHSWFIRGICNKRGEVHFDVFFFEARVVIIDVPWRVIGRVDRCLRAEIAAEIKTKVTTIRRRKVIRRARTGVTSKRTVSHGCPDLRLPVAVSDGIVPGVDNGGSSDISSTAPTNPWVPRTPSPEESKEDTSHAD